MASWERGVPPLIRDCSQAVDDVKAALEPTWSEQPIEDCGPLALFC
jgi:hypothetical protein